VSELWKQLGHLFAEDEEYPLFYANNSGFLIPQLDYHWPSAGSENHEKMKAFYIAVGRILGACVAKGIPIAAHVLVSSSSFVPRLCELLVDAGYSPHLLQAGLLQELSPSQLES
jgi:hypothetical protein